MSAVTLVSVYAGGAGQPSPEAIDVLWKLMLQREPHQNISHRQMPTPEQHRAFVASKPYLEWFLLRHDEQTIGAVYVTRQHEIGLFILKDHQHRGFGKAALDGIKARHPDKRLLANIAPGNEASQQFFQEQGFRLIQYTYEFQP